MALTTRLINAVIQFRENSSELKKQPKKQINRLNKKIININRKNPII